MKQGRINYKQMGRKIRNKKYKTLKKTKQTQYTCEYSEGEKHSLCTHKERCVLDPELWELNKKINYKQMQLKNLKESLRNGLDLMKKYPDKKSYELKVDFYPNQMRLDIKLMENELKELRKEEMKIR